MIPARVESAVQTFNFEGKAPVRTVMQGDEPWFVAADVCTVLEHSNAREAIRHLDDDEKGVSIADTPGGPQEINLISESGLYTLILRSRKPQARPFRRWVTHEVLPALRKDGRYDVPQPALSDLQTQITELRTVIESKATRVAAPPALAEKIRLAELSMTCAIESLTDALKGLHSGMNRLGIHRVGERHKLPPLA